MSITKYVFMENMFLWRTFNYHQILSYVSQVKSQILAVLSKPALFARTIYGTGGSFRQRTGDLAPLDGCACLFEGSLTPLLSTKVPCHDFDVFVLSLQMKPQRMEESLSRNQQNVSPR